MYKYKGFRSMFRAFNLIVYAIVASVAVVAISSKIYISNVMDSIFHGYFMDSKRSLLLAVFLLGNMFFILFFKLISKNETEALLYYICDFVIRITFSIPVSFIIFYFVLYRFLGEWFMTAISQAIVFVVLFAVFDYLMRWQIKFQLGVNYFKIHDRV